MGFQSHVSAALPLRKSNVTSFTYPQYRRLHFSLSNATFLGTLIIAMSPITH